MQDVGINALQRLIGRVSKGTEFDRPYELWNVLSALRGPDIKGGQGCHVHNMDQVDDFKDKYTGPIRAWISPEWNRRVSSTTTNNIPTLNELLQLRQDVINDRSNIDNDALNHYLSHIKNALDVMIKVEEIEKLDKEKE